MSPDIVKIDKMEYRPIIKYLFLKGLNGNEIYEDTFKTLGHLCPSYATVTNWVASFKRGKFLVEDDERPGRPIFVSTTENIDAIHDMILSDRRIGIKHISKTFKISSERVNHIIHFDLDTKKISAKWIPKCLNADQKRARVEPSRSLCARFDNDPDSVNHLIRLYFYDLETKQQWMEWKHSGSTRLNMFRVQKSA